MTIRCIALMATLAASLLSAPTASACSLNPTAVISAPAASSSHIHGTGVSFVGTSSTANCGWISAYIWKNGVTVLSYSSSFPYNVTLEPEQVDSVITVSLQVINSYGRSHTVNRTITIKRDHQSQYFVKDHLGSPRVVVDGKGAVLSHTDYYPFGMVMPDRAANISLANDRVKFTGYLLEEEGGQDTYHAEARGYDPVIGRFTSVDPLTAKMPGWNPYHYSFNNPIKYVDPTGMAPDIYVFDQEGNYTGDKIKKEGEHVGRVMSDDGNSFDFAFADPVNDPSAIDEGVITGLIFPSDSDINQTVNDSGVYSEGAQSSPLRYAYSESRGTNRGEGEGKMDYISGPVTIGGAKQDIDLRSKLYITANSSGVIAHNGNNYGNFLWGASMKALGVGPGLSKLGANVDAIINNGQLDSVVFQKVCLEGSRSACEV